MKKAFFLLLACCGCDLFKTEPFECAPNDSFTCATEPILPFDISITMQKQAFYKFDLSKGDGMIVIYESPGESERVLLEWFDQNTRLLSSTVFNKPLEYEHFIFNPPVSDASYYLKITDLDYCEGQDSPCAGKGYGLSLDWETADPYELNNSLLEAAPIAKGDSIVATLNPVADRDYFRLVLTQPDSLVLSISQVPANLRLELNLLDGGGIPLVTMHALCEGHSLQLPYLLAPGTYYLQVSEMSDDAANDMPYTLTID